MKIILSITAVSLMFTSALLVAQPTKELVLASEVQWEMLNPARGEKSPQAGTLWGNRKGSVATGFLAKFVDGFSSPPHIHNRSYRAVVISGGIHNDDPDAAAMWMGSGSFWTQPEGEIHITAAKGVNNMALVEIDKGPYLVLPTEKAFDNGERAINIDASNIVWLDFPGVETSTGTPKVSYLWGSLEEGQANGSFVKLPAGFNGRIHSYGSTFRAVVIKGQILYQEKEINILDPGSYFGSFTEAVHNISTKVEEQSVIYIRTNGKFDLVLSE